MGLGLHADRAPTIELGDPDAFGKPGDRGGAHVDFGTVIGIVAGFGLIIAAIAMDSPLSSFINPSSIMIVFGGTFAATMVAERLSNVLNGIRVALNAFTDKTKSPRDTIDLVGELALAARKDGILALEGFDIEDTFLSKAVRLAVDGIAPEEIRASLNGELQSLSERHKRGQKLFRFMGSIAPSMGMVGTLIGLVQMLQSLSDPSSIGPAMAIALLTTLYGAILAFLVCIPIAEKLENRTKEEQLTMKIVMDGVEGILKGENPRLIVDKLEGFLAPGSRTPPDPNE